MTGPLTWDGVVSAAERASSADGEKRILWTVRWSAGLDIFQIRYQCADRERPSRDPEADTGVKVRSLHLSVFISALLQLSRGIKKHGWMMWKEEAARGSRHKINY